LNETRFGFKGIIINKNSLVPEKIDLLLNESNGQYIFERIKELEVTRKSMSLFLLNTDRKSFQFAT
jgi:hypothetical protein